MIQCGMQSTGEALAGEVVSILRTSVTETGEIENRNEWKNNVVGVGKS